MTGVHLHHFQSTPHPPSIANAPCTEVATFFNCEDDMVENVAKFSKAIDQGKPEGYVSVAYGKVIEKITKHKGGDGKEDSSAVVLLIGYAMYPPSHFLKTTLM